MTDQKKSQPAKSKQKPEKTQGQKQKKDPASRAKDASIGLLIAGIVGAAWNVIFLITGMLGTGLSTYWLEGMPEYYDQIWGSVFLFVFSIIAIVAAAFIIYASLKMKELKMWGICVAAAIIAMVPCISPCCVIGLPIGIWCLVVLMDQEVKEVFEK